MVSVPQSPVGRILPRHAGQAIQAALSDTRVVLVNGARQCGKSTLVAQFASELTADWRNLDRAVTREAAITDPTGFVAGTETMVIDEVQRVPDLLLAIKEAVDTDRDPAGSS